jgi:molybdate transport system substrate-binding protein
MRFREGNFLFLDSTSAAVSTLTFIATLWCGDLCNAADVKVLSSPAVKGVVSEIGRQFEAATGHRLVAEFDVFAVLKRRIDAGEAFDIAILNPAMIDDLVKLGKVAADTRADLGRQGISLGVRTGMPKPDISSVEAFKRTMLNATSVAYFKEGTAGRHFLLVLDRLGITTDMILKLKAYETTDVDQALAKGEAEFVVAGIGILVTLPAVEIVGSFPAELQQYITYTAGVSATSKQLEAARLLFGFFIAPTAAEVKKANGLEPSK